MPTAAAFSTVDVLRNGQRVEIRALRPTDREDMLTAVGRTSTQSLYRRFFTVRRHFSEAEAFDLSVALIVEPMCAVAWVWELVPLLSVQQ